MGKTYEMIDERLRTFIADQHVFFVATAPLASDGHVNLSPKGLDTFAILDDRTVAYLDLVGSGAETIAHLRENGRITLMWCAFTGPPNIVRIHGTGRAVLPDASEFAALASHFPDHPGARAIVVVEATRISDSCGFGVPRYEFVDERDQLGRWAAKKGDDGLADYKRKRNAVSLDGLPALDGGEG